MEEKVFRREAVASELEHYVEARLHTDHRDDATADRWTAMQEELSGNLANPVYVIVDPRDDEKIAQFEGGTLGDETPFVRFLRNAWDASRAREVARGK